MHHMRFVCNKLPAIKNMDDAAGKRCKILTFESTFCDDPPETHEEQMRQKRFPIDREFTKKLGKMAEPFAWVLLEHRKKIDGLRRIEPEGVRIATSHYQRQNDVYLQFMDECIMEDKKQSSVMSLTELYNIYKDWYRESMPGQALPVKNEIEEIFVRRWGLMEAGKKWRGYRQQVQTKDDDVIVIGDEDLVQYNPLSG